MKISVIIPVFNIEQYLSQCVESILSQSYKELEIILIDDGSTDNSSGICDKYAKADERVVVIHKQNGGAASARNEGLRKATGDLLAFVDSDDYIEPDTFSKMTDIMHRTGADIVECAFSNDFLNKRVDRIFFPDETAFSVLDYLKLYNTHWICGLACDKLFRRELLTGIFYEEGHQIDDEFFTYQGVMNATKIVYTPNVFYHYRMRASGLMRDKSTSEKMLFDRLEYSSSRRERVVTRFPELKQDYDLAYMNSLLVWARDKDVTPEVICEIQRLLKEYFKNNKPCKMNPRFRLQLLQLQCANPERFIRKRQIQEPKKDENQYYE